MPRYDAPSRTLGVASDGGRDQYSVTVLYHEAGREPRAGGQVLATIRANTLPELAALLSDFSWEMTPA